MSGDKLPVKACPRCEELHSPATGAKLHCDSRESNCCWIKCSCGATFDIYAGSFFVDPPTKPKEP